MNYCPDNWVVLKFTTHEMKTFYKVLGGWSGGYLTGDSWRLNSGITKVEEHDGCYYFSGFSGSVYRCGKESYGLRTNNAYVYDGLKEKYGLNVELMPESTDFLNLHYGSYYRD